MTERTKQTPEQAEIMVLQTMTTLSTLLTAMEVRYRVSERRVGRDPSDQEPAPDAHAYLMEAAEELEQLLTQLDRSAAYAANYDEDHLTAAVRRFDDLMRVNRAGVVLHSIHQRLLSLYPTVSERLVEQARLLYGACRETMDPEEEAYTARRAHLVEEGLALTILIRDELRT